MPSINQVVTQVIRRDSIVFKSTPKLSEMLPKRPIWPLPLVLPYSRPNAIFRIDPKEFYQKESYSLSAADYRFHNSEINDTALNYSQTPSWDQLSPDIQKVSSTSLQQFPSSDTAVKQKQNYSIRASAYSARTVSRLFQPFRDSFVDWKLRRTHPSPLLTKSAIKRLREQFAHEWEKMRVFERQTVSRRIQWESVDPSFWAVYQYLRKRVSRPLVKECDGDVVLAIDTLWLRHWENDECKYLIEKARADSNVSVICDYYASRPRSLKLGRQLFFQEIREISSTADSDLKAKKYWENLCDERKLDYQLMARMMQLCPEIVVHESSPCNQPDEHIDDAAVDEFSIDGEPLQPGVHLFMLNLLMKNSSDYLDSNSLLKDVIGRWSNLNMQEKRYWAEAELKSFPISGTLLYNLYRPREVLTPGAYSAQRALDISGHGHPVLSKIAAEAKTSEQLSNRFKNFMKSLREFPRSYSGFDRRAGVKLPCILHSIKIRAERMENVPNGAWEMLDTKQKSFYERWAQILMDTHGLIWNIRPPTAKMSSFLKFMHSSDSLMAEKDIMERARCASQLWKDRKKDSDEPSLQQSYRLEADAAAKSPRKTSGYTVFLQEYYRRKSGPISANGNSDTGEKNTRLAASEWRSLTEQQREAYFQRASRINLLGLINGHYRNQSAYNIFVRYYAYVKGRTEVSLREIAERWSKLSPNKKALIEAHLEELKLFCSSAGAEICVDGTKNPQSDDSPFSQFVGKELTRRRGKFTLNDISNRWLERVLGSRIVD